MSSHPEQGGGLAVDASRGRRMGDVRRPARGTEAIVADVPAASMRSPVSGARFTDWALAQGATSWSRASR